MLSYFLVGPSLSYFPKSMIYSMLLVAPVFGSLTFRCWFLWSAGACGEKCAPVSRLGFVIRVEIWTSVEAVDFEERCLIFTSAGAKRRREQRYEVS